MKLHSVDFNQDYGCFAVGTSRGFRIYNCEPFRQTFRRDFSRGGIGRVEMLFRCNILALVGGGSNPRYPKDKVMIWDDHQNRCIGELSFRSDVRNVKLRRDRIVVVLDEKIYVYNFADLEVLHTIATGSNEQGLVAVAPGSDPSHTVLACPSQKKGAVRIENYHTGVTKYVEAHEGTLVAIAINFTGTRIATASERGTLIRVFDTETGHKLQELRRGTNPTTIYSLCFSPDASMLACTSKTGTLHIFKLEKRCHDPAGPAAVAAGLSAGGAAGAAEPVVPTPAEPPAAEDEPPEPATVSAAGGPAAASGGAAGAAGRGEEGEADGGAAEGVADAEGEGAGEAGDGRNAKSSLSFMAGVLPAYFRSEWSYAQLQLEDTARSICAFGKQPNTILVVSSKGTFLKADFSAGGMAVRMQYACFGAEEEGERAGGAV